MRSTTSAMLRLRQHRAQAPAQHRRGSRRRSRPRTRATVTSPCVSSDSVASTLMRPPRAELALEHDLRAALGVPDVDGIHELAHERHPAPAVRAARRAPAARVADDDADGPVLAGRLELEGLRPGRYACSTALAHASWAATVMSNTSSSRARAREPAAQHRAGRPRATRARPASRRSAGRGGGSARAAMTRRRRGAARRRGARRAACTAPRRRHAPRASAAQALEPAVDRLAAPLDQPVRVEQDDRRAGRERMRLALVAGERGRAERDVPLQRQQDAARRPAGSRGAADGPR